MKDFRVRVDVRDGTGFLRWERQAVDVDVLTRAISLAADDAIIGHDLRRLQVDLPEGDVHAMRALHRAGFRREGRLREAHETPDGQLKDVLVYARLASDVVLGPIGFSGVMDSVLPTKRVIAHVVLRDDRGRVLLVETTYKEDWELPGGVVEPGETPREGAQREVLEEVGIVTELGQPAVIDWMPPSLGWSDAIEFLYDGGVLSPKAVASLVPEAGEIRTIHWVDPDEIPDKVSELSARRLPLVLEGVHGMTEDGRLIEDPDA